VKRSAVAVVGLLVAGIVGVGCGDGAESGPDSSGLVDAGDAVVSETVSTATAFSVTDVVVVGSDDPWNDPHRLAISKGAIWLGRANGALSRVDAGSLVVSDTAEVCENSIDGLSVHDGAVWVACTERLARVDIETLAVTDTLSPDGSVRDVASAGDAVWIVHEEVEIDDVNGEVGIQGHVSRVDPTTVSITDSLDFDGGADGVTVSENDVWVTDTLGGTLARVSRIDPVVTDVVAIGTGGCRGCGTYGAAVVGDAIWVVKSNDEYVSDAADDGAYRLDLDTLGITDSVLSRQSALSSDPTSIAASADAVWVGGESGVVALIDPDTRVVSDTLKVAEGGYGAGVNDIVASDGVVWVATDEGNLVRIA
jgi:streptogramin lyase